MVVMTLNANVLDLAASRASDTTAERHRCCNARAAVVRPPGDPRSFPTSVPDCVCNLGQVVDTLQVSDGGRAAELLLQLFRAWCQSRAGPGGYPGMPVSGRYMQ